MQLNQFNRTRKIKSAHKFRIFQVLLVLLFLHIPAALLAQTQADDLIICVNNIAINGELTIRGLTANFPYPVLSMISVVDSQANIVPGLADTLRWLGPNDTAENGMPMADIWQPLKEFHRADSLYPPDPDLYHQTRMPLITEIRYTDPIPTCTKLVLDVSSSMEQEIEDAKEGARIYIRLLRSFDSVGIVQFAGDVVNVQEMTRDTTVLLDNINNIRLYNGTAVYDALMAAINGLKNSRGRRSIIIYTDGADNRSHVTPEAVIDSAQAYNLPIYTIALGNGAEEKVLREIALRTSGLYFRAATAEQMQIILSKLSFLMQNYYVMAHGSTDPFYNRTWRVVDVTANTREARGRGAGNYFVGGGPEIPATDLSVSLRSTTDTTAVIDGDTLNAVTPASEFTYALRVQNLGPNTVGQVTLVQHLPDSVKFISATPIPQQTHPDSIVWHLMNVMPMMDWNISVRVRLAEEIPLNLHDLISTAIIYASADTFPENNTAADTVYAITSPIPGPEGTDLTLEFYSITDTFVVRNQDTLNAVLPGQDYQYAIQIRNSGNFPADSVQIWQRLPDSTQFIQADREPQFRPDLFWRIDRLAPGETARILVDVHLADVPHTLTELISQAEIAAKNDTNQTNNSKRDTTQVIFPDLPAKNFNLSIKQRVAADTTIFLANQTEPAVFIGNTYSYTLIAKNGGPGLVRNFEVWNVLPDSVSLIGSDIPPARQNADSLFWQIAELPPVDSITIILQVKLANHLPFSPFPLLNQAGIVAPGDTLTEDNTAATLIYGIYRELPHPDEIDISVRQYAETDSFEISGSDTLKFVIPSEKYVYHLRIQNETDVTAPKVTLVDIFPEYVSVTDFLPAPGRIAPDSLVWEIGDLQPRASFQIQFSATVPVQMPPGITNLINQIKARAEGEKPEFLSNNTSSDTVFSVSLPPTDWVPLIQALPARISVGAKVQVKVQATTEITNWDLWVRRANDETDSTYADNFITGNPLVPNLWHDVQPEYPVTKMVTEADEEPIIFELRGVDAWGVRKAAQAAVTIQRVDDFTIDQNVFEPNKGGTLQIRFKLDSDQSARLEIYDITGTRITKLTDAQFQAGWNTYVWDGLTEFGQKIGSGFYIITMESGRYHAWKKLLIVR